MSTLGTDRDDHTADPLSPFQPSNPRISSNKKQGKPSSNRKSDLDFIQKVTNTTATGNIFWDQTAKTSDVMAKPSLTSSEKAVHAFKDLRRRRRVKEQFSDFCSETSFTALTRIYKASSWRRQLGWTILLLGMLCWMCLQCYWLLEKFFNYPTEVKMDILAAKELEFPSVSVCNLNPIKMSALENSENFRSLSYFTDKISNDDVLYDYYYSNLETLFLKGSGENVNTATWSTQTQPVGQTPGTGTAPTTTPGGGTGPPSTPAATQAQTPPQTPSQSSQSSPQTSSSTSPGTQSPPAGPASGRRRRSVTNDETPLSLDPALHVHLVDHYLNNNNNNHNNNNNDDDDDIVEDFNKEADWRALEREIFGEEGEGPGGRFRRGASDESSGGHTERLDVLRNNSFNKWNALDNSNITDAYYATRGTEYKSAMAYATVAAYLPEDVVKDAGHQLTDFLLTCRYNGWQCSPKNFTYFHSHKFGNCFTFNDHTFDQDLQTKFAGPEYGLTLEMYIQQDEYVPALAAEAGVRVMIHPKGRMPFPEDEGMSIPPVHSTSISIRKREIIRLEPPHGTCDYMGSTLDVYTKNYNTSYSKLSCLKSCYQTIVNRYCNCSLPMYYISDKTNVCNMTDQTVDMCTAGLTSAVPDEYATCDVLCPQPCYEVEYDMLSSSAAWPSEKYEDYLINKLKQSNYLLMDGKKDDHFVKLNVYFKDLMYEKVEQQKAYESENLISDIGGQLGLWLGLSAITIGEICGLFISLFRSLSSVGPKKDDDAFDTPVKPFSKDLEPASGGMMLNDVKSRGFV